ncbi:unnamed protein product [Fusarium graminearum]|nr:unnamed protein product [Fusarium graminearum]
MLSSSLPFSALQLLLPLLFLSPTLPKTLTLAPVALVAKAALAATAPSTHASPPAHSLCFFTGLEGTTTSLWHQSASKAPDN